MSTHTNNEVSIVTPLDKSQPKDANSVSEANPPDQKKIKEESKTSLPVLNTPFGNKMPLISSGMPLIEAKPSVINQFTPSIGPRISVINPKVTLIDPKVLALEKANNEKEMNPKRKTDEELKRQGFESPNYSNYCNVLRISD